MFCRASSLKIEDSMKNQMNLRSLFFGVKVRQFSVYQYRIYKYYGGTRGHACEYRTSCLEFYVVLIIPYHLCPHLCLGLYLESGDACSAIRFF
jgi:hypothetical protein